MPLIITHGWPGSVIEFMKVIGPLTEPDDPADAFHLVSPRSRATASATIRRRPAGARARSPLRGTS